MSTSDRTDHAAVQLLRQLGIAFSTYRLYPGDLGQPALAAAVERLAEAAAVALSTGALGAEIRSGRFYLKGKPVEDDRADRLADACFQRRVEHLQLRRIPTVAELGALFEALTREPDDVAAAGGVEALLGARGATAIVASEGVPDPSTGLDDPAGQLTAAERVDDDLPAPDPDAALPALAARPGETAAGLYERLRAVGDALSDDVLARSSFFRRAAALADELPPSERATFGGLVLDRAPTEPFAERYVGQLTDIDLARLVAETAVARGAEPVGFAADVAADTGRHDALVRLVEAAVAQAPGPADGAPAPDAAEPGAPEGHRLRDGFPDGPDEGRALGLTALRDYLRAAPDAQQAERVVAAATTQLRVDVRERAPDRISELLAVIDEAGPHTSPAVRPLLATPQRAALTSDVLTELARELLSDERAANLDVLGPFGPAAEEALVQALADESRRTVRGLLVGLLAALVADDPGRLEPYFDDPRWFVVRNLAAVLRRVGGKAAVPLLERLARHEHEAVRREALHGLAGLPPDHAAPVLARLAVDFEQRDERVACLEALADFDSPVATRLLEELAARRRSPRLPWSLRRQARALARRGRHA